MEWLNNWWAQISAVERIFWFIATPSSVILILQLILEFIGSGSNDADVNFDADANLDVDVKVLHEFLPELFLLERLPAEAPYHP